MIDYDKNNNIQPDIKDIYKTTRSGLKLPVHIFMPQVKNDKNAYAIICIHGGGWRSARMNNDEWDGGIMAHQAKVFAALGYIGISISYRDLRNPNTDITDLIDDCRQAVLYVKKKLGTDNKHLILIGDSAGAHLATCLGISDDDEVRPEIVISCNPVLDCTGVFSYASDSEEVRLAASPLFRKINKCSKFLFMHGDKDPTVPVEDCIKMNERLINLGFDSEMITLKNVLHAFILYGYRSTDEEVFEYMTMIESYLDKKLSKMS